MKTLLFSLIFILLIIPYQNCGSKLNFASMQKSQMSGGNGDSYSGKPGTYLYFNPGQQCADLDKNGQPFPNAQIFVSGTQASLVRNNCQDMEPVVLDPSTYTIDSVSGTIVYNGQTFDYRADLTVYVKTEIPCPTGMSPIANATPTNLISDPIHLNTSNWKNGWNSVSLFGSLEALPRYRIERTDPTKLENWRRIAQVKNLTGGAKYALSAVLMPGSQDYAILHYYYDSSRQFGLHVNIATGATQFSHNLGMPGVTATSSPYGAGRLVTVFFDAAGSALGSDVGIATSNASYSAASVGDYIYSTAVSLQAVSGYCQ